MRFIVFRVDIGVIFSIRKTFVRVRYMLVQWVASKLCFRLVDFCHFSSFRGRSEVAYFRVMIVSAIELYLDLRVIAIR